MHILGAIAEFERARISERVKAGLARAKANGRQLGRPRLVVGESVLAAVRGLSVRQQRRSSESPLQPRTGGCGRRDGQPYRQEAV